MLNFSIKALLRIGVATICVAMFLYWYRTPDKIIMDSYGIEMPKVDRQQ